MSVENYAPTLDHLAVVPRPDYKILKDEAKNEHLINKGFVVLEMLNEDDIQFFKDLYTKWHPTSPKEFYKSYFSDNLAYKTEVEDAIMRICMPKIEQYFTDCNAFGAMFVIKPQGDGGHIPPHQDWSFVDEKKHWSLNMWIPLQDVTERNGTMRFLTGSQFFFDTIRGANTPEPYNGLEEIINQNLEDVPLKAGEAVFFYHGIVHCSHYNEKMDERICLGLSLTQKEAPIYFHFLKDGDTYAEKFNVQPAFFMEYTHNRGKMPDNITSLGKDERPFVKLSEEQLLNRIENAKRLNK